MSADDDLPRSFDLLVWGAAHPRMLTALRRAKLPPGVEVSKGPLGAVVRIPLFTDAAWFALLLGRVERALHEGGLEVGLLPERPLTVLELRERWESAVRTRAVAQPLTKKPPSVKMPGSVAPDWGLDE